MTKHMTKHKKNGENEPKCMIVSWLEKADSGNYFIGEYQLVERLDLDTGPVLRWIKPAAVPSESADSAPSRPRSASPIDNDGVC